jgi:xylulose-5-phosphate/fructose-6-phosphate phosphoketolase
MDSSVVTQDLPKDADDRGCSDTTLTFGADESRKMDAYWRASHDVSVGQIYVYDNPLLREPLTLDHVKPLWSGIGARLRG